MQANCSAEVRAETGLEGQADISDQAAEAWKAAQGPAFAMPLWNVGNAPLAAGQPAIADAQSAGQLAGQVGKGKGKGKGKDGRVKPKA
eukprot:10909868-Alexandrium_andersonii.AAC.1